MCSGPNNLWLQLLSKLDDNLQVRLPTVLVVLFIWLGHGKKNIKTLSFGFKEILTYNCHVYCCYSSFYIGVLTLMRTGLLLCLEVILTGLLGWIRILKFTRQIMCQVTTLGNAM